MSKTKTIFITAGGTGGHIYPALAIAKKLHSKNYKVIWIGSNTALEQKILQDIPWLYLKTSVRPLRGKKIISGIFFLCISLLQCCGFFWRHRPSLVIATGGYASFPASFCAILSYTPLFVCEQNSISGLVNRYLAPFSKILFTAYPNVYKSKYICDKKIKYVGNPLRDDIIESFIKSKEEVISLPKKDFKILILGGSQGASVLNKLMPELFSKLKIEGKNIMLLHQCGGDEKLKKNIILDYSKLGVNAEVFSFSNEMALMYSRADLVIARAGALTLSELAAMGKPSLLIPLPNSVDNHQYHNASFYQKNGASWIVDQDKLYFSNYLVNMVGMLIRNEKIYIKMIKSAKYLAKVDSLDIIFKECEKIVK